MPKRLRYNIQGFVVGTTELESVTSCMSSMRSNQLSYAPIAVILSILPEQKKKVKHSFNQNRKFFLNSFFPDLLSRKNKNRLPKGGAGCYNTVRRGDAHEIFRKTDQAASDEVLAP